MINDEQLKKTETKVKSLSKAIDVLECFSTKEPELGITDIATKLKLPKSTVHNILNTYKDRGYVSQNAETGKYYLGIKLLQFSYIINTHLGIRNLFLPYVQKIVDKVGETAFLGVPYGKDVMYIESLSPANIGPARNILGEHAPLYCTGVGKAMLAFMNDFEKHIPETLKSFTETTITDKRVLSEQLETIRRVGYSVDNMEHEYGVKCVATPILGHDGNVIAGISISAPSLRMDDHAIVQAAQTMKEILAPIQGIL